MIILLNFSTSSAPQKPVHNVVKDSPAIATVKQVNFSF